MGIAEIRQIFNGASERVLGVFVNSGFLTIGETVNIYEGGEILGKSDILEIRRYKDKPSKAERGMEYGVILDFEYPLEEGLVIISEGFGLPDCTAKDWKYRETT